MAIQGWYCITMYNKWDFPSVSLFQNLHHIIFQGKLNNVENHPGVRALLWDPEGWNPQLKIAWISAFLWAFRVLKILTQFKISHNLHINNPIWSSYKQNKNKTKNFELFTIQGKPFTHQKGKMEYSGEFLSKWGKIPNIFGSTFALD